ncbi:MULTISPECIES: ArsR/SmtB family transcription factor [unclassified Schlesneria]|uniref:ArsR/SmtB family transcription factor n=1 Tax=Schlesneria TaxID=656899 RepID=UPI002EF2ACBE
MSQDSLSAVFAALADPTRRAILSRLREGEASVGELSQPFDMSPPAITKHLKVLERTGLIKRGRDAQWRPCRLSAEPLKEVLQWVEQYREFWDGGLDRLDEHLKQLNANASRKQKGTDRAEKK